MNLSPRLWNAVIVTSLLGTSPVQADSCSVPGGTSSSPTDFARYVSNEACNEFILQDGWYTFPNLSRSAITIRAEHAGKAQIKNGFAITAPGLTIDGISRDGERGPIAVHAPGTIIRNCRFSNFGKTVYGRAVWVRDESLSAEKITVIANNTFDDWGGAPASACVIIGTTQDAPHVMERICVHVLNNRFVHGPTAAQKPQGGNSAIQAFNPFLAAGNYIDTVNGPAIQNKTKNSKIVGNTIVNCNGILWMPVVYPGFSWDNLKQQPPGATEIPRRRGQFLWEQFHELSKLGVDTVYVAMFDEGTAIFKVRSTSCEALL